MPGLPSALPVLRTPRLILWPLSREMVAGQLKGQPFVLALPEVGPVHFDTQWPSGALGFFPGWAEHPELIGGWVIVQASEAVGTIGPKGPLTGAVDIGYGLRPQSWNQGVASEAAQAVSVWLLSLPQVERVTADTAISNAASARVLEKAGFAEIGRSFSEEDGELRLWAKVKTSYADSD